MIDALVKSRFKHVKSFLLYGAFLRRGEWGDWSAHDDVFKIGPKSGADSRIWLKSYGGSRYIYGRKADFLRLAKRKLAGR